jgi:signal transduction histidine kinase
VSARRATWSCLQAQEGIVSSRFREWLRRTGNALVSVTWADLAAAFPALLIAIGIEVARRLDLHLPTPFLLLLASMVLAASLRGQVAGNLAAAFASAFVAYATAVGYGPGPLTGSVLQAAFGIACIFVVGNVLGRLRDGRLRAIEALQQAQAELETHRTTLQQQVRAQTERLRAMTRHVMDANEHQRASIARELHDELGQTLAGVQLSLSSIRVQDRNARRKIDTAAKVIGDIIADLRTLSLALRPPLLDRFGLAAGIGAFIEQQASLAGLHASIDLDTIPQSCRHGAAILLFRCVEEVVNNVVKHAEATSVEVELRLADGTIHLRIEDDGRGFSPPADWTSEAQCEHGIAALIERFDLAGGKFSIQSAPGRGTCVRASVPAYVVEQAVTLVASSGG